MASAQEKAWLARYLVHFNAKRAAEEVGYQWPRRMGYKKKQKFKEEIAAALEEKAMTAEEALARLSEQARAEYAEYLTDEGTVNLTQLLDDGKGHLIKGYKRDRKGNLIVEFYDGQTALRTILDHHHKAGSGPQEHVVMSLDEWKDEAERRRKEAEQTMAMFNEANDEEE